MLGLNIIASFSLLFFIFTGIQEADLTCYENGDYCDRDNAECHEKSDCSSGFHSCEDNKECHTEDALKEPKMPIDLYYTIASAPCRSVMLAAKAIGIDLNLKKTNLMAGEHLTPEYLEMNPQHTIPTINDNGFHLWESRAILSYLADQYGKDESLYPKDPKKRALVNQRLYFDIGTLYQRFMDYYFPILFAKAPADPQKMKKLEEAYQFLDKFLEGQDFVAGKSLTIADLSIISSVSTAEIIGFDITRYPNVNKWFENTKQIVPGYEEINHAGCLELKKMCDMLSQK